MGEVKCRSCGLIDTYYLITPKGQDKIKLLIENQIIDLDNTSDILRTGQ